MLTLAYELRKRQSTSTSTISATSKRTKHGIGRAMAKVNEVLASLDTEEKSGSDSSSSNEEEENVVVTVTMTRCHTIVMRKKLLHQKTL